MSRLLLNQSIVSMTMNMNSSASSTSTSTSTSNNHRLPGLSFGESNGSPGISFPLGTGLVVLIILFVSGLFSFCYHWLSLRKNASSSSSSSATHDSPHHHPCDDCFKPPTKLSMVQCPPVVYMAGEEMPRFIAVPCPLLKPCAEESRDAEKQVLGDVTLIDDLKLDIKL